MSDINALRTSIANAVTSRLADVKSASMTDSNVKKLNACVAATANDEIATLLLACNYDASAIAQNVYSVEKAFDLARDAANKSVNFASIYCNATIASMIACEKAEIEITRETVSTFCTNDVKTKYDAKIKSTRVQSVKSNSTVATQHNSTINAMLALHMFNVARNAANKETFTLNRENEIVKAICAKRELTL